MSPLSRCRVGRRKPVEDEKIDGLLPRRRNIGKPKERIEITLCPLDGQVDQNRVELVLAEFPDASRMHVGGCVASVPAISKRQGANNSIALQQ